DTGKLHIGQRQHRTRGPGYTCAIEMPLVAQRTGARRNNIETDGASRWNCLVLRRRENGRRNRRLALASGTGSVKSLDFDSAQRPAVVTGFVNQTVKALHRST